jgi:pimeloyl-ACP methyl ester carboxylesterase
MDNALLATPRRYGPPPFRVAVIHGGPGAPGEVAPVGRKLGTKYGVLEPFQTADSVSGQVEELADCLKTHGSPPLTLVGYSWGAWLALSSGRAISRPGPQIDIGFEWPV